MKKTIILTTALMVCFTIFQLSATGINMLNHGTQTYGKETIDKIQTNGFVKLDGTKISERLQVNGRLKAIDAQIEEMQINGQATLDNCSVRQKSVVCGALVATSSNFANELSVASERVVFNSCALSSLRILQVGGYQGVQVVELRGKTKINGPITFESGKGEVITDPDSDITGDVIGRKSS